MFNLGLGFEEPWYLLLLVLIPILWVMSYKSLAGLGRLRSLLAISLRTLLLLLFICALAEIQLRKTSEKVTVIYLLDQSESIPLPKRQMMFDYVSRDVEAHRRADREDRAGLIIFGRDAQIEIPPFEDNIPALVGLDAELTRTDATDLETALKLAQASFPADSMKRIVLVTDGNENKGDARSVLPVLAGNEIGLDVVPVTLSNRSEIVVEKIAVPSDVRKGQPIDLNIVMNNYSDDDNAASVPGTIRVLRQIGAHDELIGEEEAITLKPGKTVVNIEHEIEEAGIYTYKAIFTPDNPDDDLMNQNNVATAYTHVQGKGRVLMIVDADHPGRFDFLISRMQENDVVIDKMLSNQLFTSIAELQTYDSVIMADVPRTSGDDVSSISGFSDNQVMMLVRNAETFGSGLIMIGGPNSFGAGGWSNSELEKAMPIDFQIKNAKVQAVGALVLMMHASEMAQGNYWQEVVARKAIEALGPMDYCGLVHWGPTGDEWLWGGKQGLLRVSGKRKMMISQVKRMTPGDMPEFEPATKMALAGFNRVKASIKHMIVISDGDPSPPRSTTINSYKQRGIKISTVAVGAHGTVGHSSLQRIANQTGGKYYKVTNPKALPKIYQKEARRVARPVVKEFETGVSPLLESPHEILQGIDPDTIPPISGFVMTSRKDNPLAEVHLRSPEPRDADNSTVLASWTYKAGRTAVLTTDAGSLWTKEWTSWENYDKFFSQLIRWSMRPVNEEDNFSIATDIRDGKVRVVVTALDKDDNFLNLLNMSAAGIAPNLEKFDIKMRQVASGRYVGEFDIPRAGSYFLSVLPGPKLGTIISGVNIPYSSEFRERDTNRALLKVLASSKPKGGQAGKVMHGTLAKEDMAQLLQTDTYRQTLAFPITSQGVWPLFVLISAGVFFADIFVRRVQFSYEWIEPIVRFVSIKLLKRNRNEEIEGSIDRLRNQKAAIKQQIDERRAATRFEPQTLETTEQQVPERDLNTVLADASKQESAATPKNPVTQEMAPGETAEEDYTSRLLKAKKQAWKDQSN